MGATRASRRDENVDKKISFDLISFYNFIFEIAAWYLMCVVRSLEIRLPGHRVEGEWFAGVFVLLPSSFYP